MRYGTHPSTGPFITAFPSSPLLSPDGEHCAFLVNAALEREDRYQSDIWLAEPEGGARALVSGRFPKLLLWLDSETLLFTENRDSHTVCSVVSLRNGEVRPTYEFPHVVIGLWKLGPDALLVQAILPAPKQKEPLCWRRYRFGQMAAVLPADSVLPCLSTVRKKMNGALSAHRMARSAL